MTQGSSGMLFLPMTWSDMLQVILSHQMQNLAQLEIRAYLYLTGR